MSSVAGSAPQPPTTIVVTLPDDDADEIVLSDEFEDGDDDTWGESTWTVDVPGEATATVIDGVGVMATDARGTHEWVRAVAPGSTHDDATLTATVTPIESSEGTVFVGMHGDGEWRDSAPYLPQTGVVVEYSYADVFLGERASEAVVKTAKLHDRRVLAFATHGLTPGDLNGIYEPALALTHSPGRKV